MSEETTTSNGEKEPERAAQTASADETKKPRSRSRPRKKAETTQVTARKSGGSKKSTEGESAEERDSMDRAEQIVSEWTARAGQAGTDIGHRFVRLFARAREEAEDIWAEAQAMRQSGTQQDESQQ